MVRFSVTISVQFPLTISTGSAKLYLAAVLDLYSRFIVGWAVSAVNDRHLTIKALEMALKRRCPQVGLPHHSDRGCTYASEDYQAILSAHGTTCSMSRRGNCHDNAVMESFFSIGNPSTETGQAHPEPLAEDIALTRRLASAEALLGIEILGHASFPPPDRRTG